MSEWGATMDDAINLLEFWADNPEHRPRNYAHIMRLLSWYIQTQED